MPDFSEWGAAGSGARLAEQDDISNFYKVAAGQHMLALARQESIKADAQAAQMQAFAGLKTPAIGEPGVETMADVNDNIALQLYKAGQPVEGSKAANRSAQMRFRTAEAGAQGALQSEREMKTELALNDKMISIYAGARDERSWATAHMLAGEMYPGEANPLADVPYSPQAADRVRATLLKEKDRLHAVQEQRITDARVANYGNLADFRSSRLDILQQNADTQSRRVDIYEKNAGKVKGEKPIGFPTKVELGAAEDKLKAVLPFPLPGDEMDAARQQVASDAKALMRANPALAPDQALQRAVTKAVEDGDLVTVSKLYGSKTTFQGGGKTPETALPATRDTKFKSGRYYNTPKGVMKFDGKGFVAGPVKAAPTRAAPVSQEEDDTVDAEEE